MATVEPQLVPPPVPDSTSTKNSPESPEILEARIVDGVRLGPYETTYRATRGYCLERTIVRP